MAKIKDIPKDDRPREKFFKYGPDLLSKSELLAILLGSGIKNKNVKELSDQIIKKFGKNFLDTSVKDLQKISGIGPAKALQISAAFNLVKRILEEETPKLKKKIKKDLQKSLFDSKSQKNESYSLQNRRYIGNKHKLIEWIFSILDKECKGKTFTDIFAGTGVVAAVASKHFDEIILNDFLYSNEVIYKAFFDNDDWNSKKINSLIDSYNNIDGEDLDENYFSINFGGKYFSNNSAKIIGFVRDDIEKNKENLTEREYSMLISSLLYSIDKIANTVGHYDAYFKKEFVEDNFLMRPINPVKTKSVTIFREDANLLAKQIKTDIIYIDPPYNSRQYSRFYHVLETLTKWSKPKLHGVALKPEPENMSDYCRVSAKDKFAELVNNINAKYLVVSYNNTYDSKSNSSQNKITLEEIKNILTKRGKTKIFEKDYRHFNAGNTDFNNHKEYLFVTKTTP